MRWACPYSHFWLRDYHSIVPYFHCLDLYLVTSRDQGGPKAILECKATGVPIVSTRVGMAQDLIRTGNNGFVAEVEDADGIAEAAIGLIKRPELRRRCIGNGLVTAAGYDWRAIGMQYYEKVYRPLLAA